MLNQPLAPIAPGLAGSVTAVGGIPAAPLGGVGLNPGMAASGMAMPNHLNYSQFRDPITGQTFGLHVEFIKKVWAALTFQWFLVTLLVLATRYSPDLALQLSNPTLLWGSIILLLIISVLTTFFYHWTKICQVPVFFLFSLLSAVLIAHLTTRFPKGILYNAVLLTFLIVLLITIYAWNTMGSIIDGPAYLIILTVLVLAFIYHLFFSHLPALCVFYTVGLVLLYTIFLIYYTHVLESKFGTIYGWEDSYLASQSMLFDWPQLFRNLLNCNNLAWRM